MIQVINSEGVAVAESTNDGETYEANSRDDIIGFSSSKVSSVTSGEVTVDDAGDVTATGEVDNGGLQSGTYTYNANDGELQDKDGNVVAISTDIQHLPMLREIPS